MLKLLLEIYSVWVARKQGKRQKIKNFKYCCWEPHELHSTPVMQPYSSIIGKRTHAYPLFCCISLYSSEILSLFASSEFFGFPSGLCLLQTPRSLGPLYFQVLCLFVSPLVRQTECNAFLLFVKYLNLNVLCSLVFGCLSVIVHKLS